MTELTDFLGLDQSTMTGLADQAEKRGLLKRLPNPADGRAVDVRISLPGAELGERIYTQAAVPVVLYQHAHRADQRRLRTLLESRLDRP